MSVNKRKKRAASGTNFSFIVVFEMRKTYLLYCTEASVKGQAKSADK